MPPLFAVLIAGWAARHRTPREASFARTGEEDVLPAGDGLIEGELIGPSGSPVASGVPVHLVREQVIEGRGPTTWRCCERCTLPLLDEGCRTAPLTLLGRTAFGLTEIVASKTTVTGPDGGFAFGGLPRGRYAVWATAPRGSIALARNAVATATGTWIVLESPFRASLFGSVVSSSDGHPIAGAAVTAIDTRLGLTFEAASDPAGIFEIPDLDRGAPYYVIATARGSAPQGRASVWPGNDLVFELPDAAGVGGVVLRNGLPKAGVRVDLDDGVETQTTELGGRFHFEGLPPGDHLLTMSDADRFGRRLDVTLEPGQMQTLTLDLVRSCDLTVRVEDPSGQPIARSSVRLMARTSIVHSAGLTNERGEVRFEMLPVGPYDAEASRADLGHGERTIGLASDCREQREKLVVPVGPGLHGQVVGEDGRPIPGAAVGVEPIGDMAEDDDPATTRAVTDAAGRFRIPAPKPGEWTLNASADGFVDASARFTIHAKGAEITLEPIVLRRGSAIEGEVLDPDGEAQEGWSVFALRPGADPNEAEEEAEESYREADDTRRREPGLGTSVDAEGQFAITGLADGEYDLYAQPSSLNPRDRGILRVGPKRVRAGGGPIVLTTPGSGEIEGNVEFAGAPPPESFTVEAPGTQKAFDGLTAGFHLARAMAGTYSVFVEARGFSSVGRRVTVPEGGTVRLNVTLHASARLGGRVVDARDGQPIADATISSWLEKKATDADDHAPTSIASTRRDGHFELKDLAPGEHVLSVHADGYARARLGPYVVGAGHEQPQIEIRLEPAGVRFAGQVLDHGRLVPSAFLALRAAHDTSSFADNILSDSGGRFAFDSVEPGLHALIIAARAPRKGAETWISRRMVEIPAGGLPAMTIDLADRGGDRRIIVELLGKKRGTLLVTLRPGVLGEKRVADLDLDRLDPSEAIAVEPGRREAVFEGVPPGDYTLSVAALDPLDPMVIGYVLARPRTLVVRYLQIVDPEEERFTILLE